MRPTFTAAPGSTEFQGTLESLNAIPSDLYVTAGTTTPTNVWGGIVKVYVSMGTPDVYRISYYGLPVTACSKVASGIINASGTPNANPIRITVHNAINIATDTKDLTSVEMDATAIAALCANNTTTASSVEFDFKLTK